jgi:hypothetical protein
VSVPHIASAFVNVRGCVHKAAQPPVVTGTAVAPQGEAGQGFASATLASTMLLPTEHVPVVVSRQNPPMHLVSPGHVSSGPHLNWQSLSVGSKQPFVTVAAPIAHVAMIADLRTRT